MSLSQAKTGNIIGLLVGAFYLIFTLAPNSGSLSLFWPGVLLWQLAITLPIVWLLGQLWQYPITHFRLGHGLDWVMGLLVLGLLISSLFAEFPATARWYTWACLGYLAALYALNGWIGTARQAQRLLICQGIAAFGFIVLSLSFWFWQTLLPELDRLAILRQHGVTASFSFRSISLRNWHPLGHQNYVAGYLLLVLPLLLGLGITAKGWLRWLWFSGFALGLANLYTTSSRGGWLGILVLLAVTIAIVFWRSTLPRWQILSLTATAGLGLVAVVATNDRLRTLVLAILSGQHQGGELAYRTITNTIGWNMGIAHPWTGTGLGSVPLLYQAYRPAWAGREAELAYQLHSTPAQLWAELGGWGVMPTLLLLGLLFRLAWRWQAKPVNLPDRLSPVLIWSLFGGFLAYGVMALTDYQFDLVAINGVLVIYLAVLALDFRLALPLPNRPASQYRWHRYGAGVGAGLVVAMALWLIPVHRAWAFSSSGFEALNRDDFPTFVDRLTHAHDLAPWEPYYPSQLGWNLGELSYQVADPQVRQQQLADAIDWFRVANQISPHQEFGHSNLGWLLVEAGHFTDATQAFARSAELVPAKVGVFFGLGLSQLLSDNTELAIDALALDLLRHPMGITSPMWRQGNLARAYPQVKGQFRQQLNQLLSKATDGSDLEQYLYQVRGALSWWEEDLDAAEADWAFTEGHDRILNDLVLAISREENLDPDQVEQLPDLPGVLAIKAWQSSTENRVDYLTQAWATDNDGLPQLDSGLPPESVIQQLAATMDEGNTFLAWLHQAPSQQPRSRRLGFGVLSRHIDGPLPADYLPRIENVPMVEFFSPLLPSPTYLPELDRLLQQQRDQLLTQIRTAT